MGRASEVARRAEVWQGAGELSEQLRLLESVVLLNRAVIQNNATDSGSLNSPKWIGSALPSADRGSRHGITERRATEPSTVSKDAACPVGFVAHATPRFGGLMLARAARRLSGSSDPVVRGSGSHSIRGSRG